MKNLFKIAVLVSGFSAFAQIPVTEIYLADIEIKNNLIKIEKASDITNQKGYNNQPSFSPDGKSIFYSSENVANKKVHISSYDIKSRKTRKITNAKTSEYSPSLAPDGQNISSVVVEEDSVQRVWLFDKLKPETKKCLTEKTDSIGYYAWMGKDTLLYLKLTGPHSLRVLDLKTGEDNWICDNPTRSFKQIDATTFFYVAQEEKENKIYFFDVRTKKATLFAKDDNLTLDYVWQPDLGMLKSEDSKIYRYIPETKVWAKVADFNDFGIKIITRFAFSPDKKKLAVVSTVIQN
jgi:dipeptidyl aminopeptidase/acylaminoacyl peptidase